MPSTAPQWQSRLCEWRCNTQLRYLDQSPGLSCRLRHPLDLSRPIPCCCIPFSCLIPCCCNIARRTVSLIALSLVVLFLSLRCLSHCAVSLIAYSLSLHGSLSLRCPSLHTLSHCAVSLIAYSFSLHTLSHCALYHCGVSQALVALQVLGQPEDILLEHSIERAVYRDTTEAEQQQLEHLVLQLQKDQDSSVQHVQWQQLRSPIPVRVLPSAYSQSVGAGAACVGLH